MSPLTPNPDDAAPGRPFDGPLWRGVARIVSRPTTIADLRLHRIHLLALREWRSAGRELPADLLDEEQTSTMLGLAAAFLLRRVREAYGGRVVVMKGPDVAAYYPDPVLRPFRDLDLLVDDPLQAQRALLAGGFHVVGDERLYADIHHLQPLRWPGIPLGIEIHDRPKWLDGRRAPSTAELLEAAVPSRTSVAGIETLAPEHQAVALAVHSWAHVPLARLGHLVDVAAVAAAAERATLGSLAEEWGVGRVWRATTAAIDGALGEGHLPLSVRTWARNIRLVRERTVVESHLQRWLSAFWSEPPLPATVNLVRAVRRDILPAEGEDWAVKRARVAQAIRTPRRRLSEHHETLERRSISGPTFLDRLNKRR
jgi:hypothetical protein